MISRHRLLPKTNELDLSNPNHPIMPFYTVKKSDVDERLNDKWDKRWLLSFRETADSRASARTAISCIIPRSATNDKLPLIFSDLKSSIIINSTINSFVFDYIARQKITGNSIKFYDMRQFVFLLPSTFTPERLEFITPRVLELTFTAHDLTGFANDLGYTGAPFVWNDDRRFWLRAELDALYFMLYGIDRQDVDYIMDTFPIVKRKDEAAHGTYRTKNAILEIFDELQTLGLNRLLEYPSKVSGGLVAEGWTP